jgi:protein SCO1/2
VVLLWLASTLGWWAFAFAPLPQPPPWLAAARAACFGPMPGGLPDAAGWMMLVLAPASFLIAIAVIWGAELGPSLRRAARGRAGQAVLALATLAVVVEGTWVAQHIRTARAASAWLATPIEDTALPEDYPRRTTPAPDFALIDQHGARLALSDLAGRPVVLTFVFGHCQTMCPLIVATLKRSAAGAEVLLVTLDPWRDTPSRLPAIATGWALPPGFRVLSSRTADEVLDVARAWGVTFERNERTGDIVHPGLVFVIDGGGRIAYTFNNPPAAWVTESLQRVRGTHVLAR